MIEIRENAIAIVHRGLGYNGDKTEELEIRNLGSKWVQSHWCDDFSSGYYSVPRFWGVILPKGSIKKLIGEKLTWSDEPVELK